MSDFRLPTDVKPTHYDVTIQTDLEKHVFEGRVKIDLDIKKETSTLVFNASGLDLDDAQVYCEAVQEKEQVISSRDFDKPSERATLQFPIPLPAGSKAQLRISFRGELKGSMLGYYKSSWQHEGKIKYYALTQFEPTAARRAFPCWDEPLLKATFAITMISREDTVNLSNMPAISERAYHPSDNASGKSLAKIFSSLSTSEPTDKWKVTKFETTPPMSSYVVAYANGHFKHLESSYASPLSGKVRPLRIYATSDIIHQAQFALDVKAKVLPIYEKVFDIEYPLPKLDTLVVNDFDAGAMENWGLITGRTSVFLLHPERADTFSKKRVATVQSHEVAHMWFGNITTMEWWNYLYLNEGFATVMGEVIIIDKLFPEWKVDSMFITDHLNRALSLDAKLSSHPIEVDCPDANDINQIFDSLSYSKAASVLRMLSKYVGEEKFLLGVSLYLKKRLFGNSVTTDLWEGIGFATGINVAKIMDQWINKIGFPVLTVTESEYGIRVRQDRFLETGPADAKENETIWTIPLSLLSVGASGKVEVDNTSVLREREQSFAIDTNKPFKLNAGTTGPYRVLYTPERLAKIATEAAKEDSSFSFNDRIGLVHDSIALAKAGFSDLSSALTLVDIFRNEKEYLVWGSISETLSSVVSIWWENPRAVELLNSFRRDLYQPIIQRLGFENFEDDSVDTIQLRTKAITQAAAAKDELVIKELISRFAHFLDTGDDSKIPADLQTATYAAAVKYGGREEFEAMKRIYEKPKTPAAAAAAMYAMGASQDPKLAEETLDYILTKARDQDLHSFFNGLQANFNTRRLLASFFMEQLDVFYKRIEGIMMSYLVKFAFGSLSTEKDYKELETFFKTKDISKYNKALAQTLDTIRANAAWIKRSDSDMLEWLEKWQSKL